MKNWISEQVEQADTIALAKIDRETHRVDTLIETYHREIDEVTASTADCIIRHHNAITYEEEFKAELKQARKEITRKLARTLLNITV